jgi:putative transcriptional regulator
MAIISAIIGTVKGANKVIRYAPLWKTMDEQKVTTYTLRFKHGMSHATVQRLQADMPVSTHTLNKLCTILNCRLEDVAEYVPDE